MLKGEFWVDGADFVVHTTVNGSGNSSLNLSARRPFSSVDECLLAVFRDKLSKPSVTDFYLTDKASGAVLCGFYERNSRDDVLFLDGYSAIVCLEELALDGRWSFGLERRAVDVTRVQMLRAISNAVRNNQTEGPALELAAKYAQMYPE